MTVLAVSNISYAFGAKKVLQDVSFAAQPGQVTFLLGPNGAGKTTLFSLIAGLLDPQQGSIARPEAALGLVFQQPALDLDLTVEQNLKYYAGLLGLSRDTSKSRIGQVLAPFDLLNRKGDMARNLNGGHRRRLEIARALLGQPRLLLLDEPTVGLDMTTRRDLVAYLHQLAKSGVALLWTTHLADEVHEDDHVVVLARGRVAADGRAADLSQGQNMASAFMAHTQEPGA